MNQSKSVQSTTMQLNESLSSGSDSLDLSLCDLSSGSSKKCSDSDCSLCDTHNQNLILVNYQTPERNEISSHLRLLHDNSTPRYRHIEHIISDYSFNTDQNTSNELNQSNVSNNFQDNNNTNSEIYEQQQHYFHYRRPFSLINNNENQNHFLSCLQMNESVKNNNTNLRERFNELYQLESLNFNVNDIYNNHQFEYEADLLTNNNISMEIKKIPLRMICEEAGLNENQTNLILQLNENISREFIIDDWNSKLFKILAYILRLNFNQLTLPLPNLGRHQFPNFIDNVVPKIQLPHQMVTYNNYIGTELQSKNLITTTTTSAAAAATAPATTNDDIRDCNENFAREAQNVCRNKDLYLMLVNTAVYGNFNYKYYENLNNYHKAAEYFALSGFGDSLDSTYQFSEYEMKSSPQFPIVKTTTTNIDNNNIDDKITNSDKSKLLNSSFGNDQIQTNRNNNQQTNNNTNNNSGGVQTILNQFQPAATFFGINFPYHSQIIPPAQNFLPKTALNFLTPQQILMQSNQPTNFLTNYPTVFQPTQPMLLTNALPMSSPYFNACFNETHINTSIIQQQQQYNVIGNNSGPYDMLIYAQMLQKTQQITQTIFANSKLEQQQQQQQRPQQLNTNLANLVQISDSINIARQMNFNSTQNFLNLAKSAATNQLSVAAAAAAAAAASSSSATVSSNATEPSSSTKSENNNNDKNTFQGK